MLAGQSTTNTSTNTSQTSLDLFIALYEHSTYDVDHLYDKFAKHETRRELADLVAGKADKTTDDSLALFGQ